MDKEYGTREWASTNVNFITGCSNNCLYCYARAMAIKFGKKLLTIGKLKK
jgi:DNA repair photolyase